MAHDDYAASLVERGVLGALALVCLFVIVLARCRRIAARGLRPSYASIFPRPELLGAAVIGMFISAMFYQVLHFRHLWALLGLVAAVDLWGRRDSQGTPADEPEVRLPIEPLAGHGLATRRSGPDHLVRAMTPGNVVPDAAARAPQPYAAPAAPASARRARHSSGRRCPQPRSAPGRCRRSTSTGRSPPHSDDYPTLQLPAIRYRTGRAGPASLAAAAC